MSKFVSYKDGEIISGDGSKSPATIFVTEDGQEDAVAKGSPIEALLLEELGVVAPVEVTAPVEAVVEAPVVPTPPVDETEPVFTDTTSEVVS